MPNAHLLTHYLRVLHTLLLARTASVKPEASSFDLGLQLLAEGLSVCVIVSRSRGGGRVMKAPTPSSRKC